jgi:PAS domain S-box-containing protein
LFAIAATLATLGLRLAFDDPLGGHPALIVFILPILLSGYVGGLRGGLLATALSYLASFCLLPPLHSFHVISAPNHWPQFFLVLIGVFISVLNEFAIGHFHRRAEIAHQLSKEALLKAETIQSAIFNCPTFSCIATDAKGIIRFFNTGAEKMFGYMAGEVVDKMTPTDLQEPQEVKARAKALSVEYNAQIEPGFECLAFKASRSMEDIYDVTKIRKDGTRFVAIISVTALRNAEENIIGYLLIGTDNTARQQIEVERKRAEEQLRRTNLELEAAKSAAEQANLAKSEFLSNMSHELRTPLSAILGFAQLMESALPPPSSFQIRSINQILHGGWHLLKLINEVLDLASIESGKLLLAKESVSLSQVFDTCRDMVELQAEQRGIRLLFPRLSNPLFVRADRTRLEQILINLLSNAIKYNNDQGTVVVDCVVCTSERIRITVRDTGSGLPPEKLSQLFIPFNRLGQETSSVSGSGIGLVVSKRLAELMDGFIGVESTVGKGSVFWCELLSAEAPCVVDPCDVVEITMTDKVPGDAQHTVLYVEDNPANMELIDELVTRFSDLRLVTAVNASRGLELARSLQPQVILMDINLPGISGHNALKILREDPTTSHIPVIALSANAMARDIEKALEAGFFSYLTKPIKIKQFMTTLRAALKFAEEHLVSAA